MKKAFVVSMTLAVMSFASLTNADIVMHAFGADSCKELAGKWMGTGKATNWIIGQCVYRGTGNIANIDAAGNFLLDIKTHKESGSLLCPQQVAAVLPGTCVNNTVKLITDYGHLNGSITGNMGTATGSLKILAGVTADVVIDLQRA
jgi:hypothetical protein